MNTTERDIYKNTLGYRLSKLRFELELNKKQLADKLCISQQCITRYEKNEREPDYSFLLLLIKEYKINPDFIFGFSEDIFK